MRVTGDGPIVRVAGDWCGQVVEVEGRYIRFEIRSQERLYRYQLKLEEEGLVLDAIHNKEVEGRIISDYLEPLYHETYEETIEHTREHPAIERNADRMEGQAILRGHRITVSQLLAEIAEGGSVQEVAQNFDLDPELLREMLYEVARDFR